MGRFGLLNKGVQQLIENQYEETSERKGHTPLRAYSRLLADYFETVADYQYVHFLSLVSALALATSLDLPSPSAKMSLSVKSDLAHAISLHLPSCISRISFSICLLNSYKKISRKNDEYPHQLMALQDLKKLKLYLQSQASSHLLYSQRLRILAHLRCIRCVPDYATKTRAALICATCSTRCTFKEGRMNKFSCCICGQLTYSATSAMPGSKVTPSRGENFVRLYSCCDHPLT